MSPKTATILLVVSLALVALFLVSRTICSPALSSCDLTLFVGKASLVTVPIVWLVALFTPQLRRWF